MANQFFILTSLFEKYGDVGGTFRGFFPITKLWRMYYRPDILIDFLSEQVRILYTYVNIS
jgi:hypothetical protein